MLNRLIPIVKKLKAGNPRLYRMIEKFARRFMGKRLGMYPRLLGDEVNAVTKVLRSSQWNMAYGMGLEHERLEDAFAEYVGVPYGVAVGSGGMGLQMALRAMGLRPGDEVIHQIDTCSATAMAVMNAGVTPVFADISEDTFMLTPATVAKQASTATRAILATHMWGNPENMTSLRQQATESGWKIIEDACLSLGTMAQGKKAGSWGDVGIFSFGCIKPIQGGEGGMIVTSDEGLARELRAMRHWGDRSREFGVRDVTELSWNGRMSEIVAAVVHEQLRGYPMHLSNLREQVLSFSDFLKPFEGINLCLGSATAQSECAFSQVVLKFDEKGPISKAELWKVLADNGILVWHANFELINSLSFFKKDTWKKWTLQGDINRIEKNYHSEFEQAQRVYTQSGIGLSNMNFLSPGNSLHLKKMIENCYTDKR